MRDLKRVAAPVGWMRSLQNFVLLWFRRGRVGTAICATSGLS